MARVRLEHFTTEDGRKKAARRRGMSVKINTTLHYNGHENSSGRESDSSTVFRFLWFVSEKV